VPLRGRRQAPPRPRRRIRKLRLLALLGVLAALGLCAFTFGLVRAFAGEIEALDPENRSVEVNGTIYAGNGESILAVLRGSENRVKTGEIAAIMRQAIVAVEDRRFWEHRGIDLRGIARAAWSDIRNQRVVEGGSTITQQFIKNQFIEDQRSVSRKVREAALAWQLEQQWTKEKILTEYLNTIYFGHGAYGVQQAAKTYFDHGASELTVAEAALLAGIPADPAGYDPVLRPGRAQARRAVVLRAMLEHGAITPEDMARAVRAPLPRAQDVRRPGTRTSRAPYFTDYVTQQLVDRYGAGRVYGGGLRVRTTLDLRLQGMARAAIDKWLSHIGLSAALVAVDPKSGDVLAMVGGESYRESQFNLASQGQRQPGSAFKPFVLAAALEQGISPSTTFVSQPVEIPLGDRIWDVGNYEDSYLGTIDLRTATIHSDNAVYAQLTRLVGPGRVRETARRLGVTSPLRSYFSIGLGAQAVTPLELARAYSAFANGGYRIDTPALQRQGRRGTEPSPPRVIDEIRDRKNYVVTTNHPVSHAVLQEHSAAWVNTLLQDAVRRGTGERAALPGVAVAGKTGTTENYGDAWFVGYTPELVVAVWVGDRTRLRPMLTEYHGEPVAGGTYPALIWKSFAERALPYLERTVGKPTTDFAPPPAVYEAPGLVVQRDEVLQLDNGACEETTSVVLFPEFGPTKTADCRPNEVDVPTVVGRRLGVARALLEQQPLTPVVWTKPAAPRQRVDVVLEQNPQGGRLSSFDRVTLVVAKATHGLVPNVRGVTLRTARQTLARRRLEVSVTRFTDGPARRVVSQSPRPGVAAAPGMVVELVVARG